MYNNFDMTLGNIPPGPNLTNKSVHQSFNPWCGKHVQHMNLDMNLGIRGYNDNSTYSYSILKMIVNEVGF